MAKEPFSWFVVDQHSKDNEDELRRRSYRPTKKQCLSDFKIGMLALILVIVVCKIFGVV